MDYPTKLLELMQADQRYVVLTAENRAPLRGIPQAIPGRFLDTGITEQTMVGAAAGLALRGRVPVAHALATFLTMRAFEFIRTDVGIGGLPVKLVGYVPGFLSESNGPTHQALEDVALMRGIPGMQVFCPADEEDLVAGLPAFLQSAAPGYLRFNARPAPTRHLAPFEIGRAEVLSHGQDIALLVYGTLFTEAWKAKSILESQGLSVQLLNLRTVQPVDEKAIVEAMRSCRLTVTLEDHFLRGGLFSILAEICLRHRYSPAVLPLAMDNTWFQPTCLADILEGEGFTGAHLARKILKRWSAS